MNKLAIVIPYFKVNHFEETIKSLADQNNQNFSIYIGNDCSPDNPMPILEKYLHSDRYKYFYYENNYGRKSLSMQWERILENVTEEWVQILGDDDFIEANFVERFYEELPLFEGRVKVVKYYNILISETGHVKTIAFDSYKSGFYNTLNQLLLKFKGGPNSSLSEHVFCTNTLKAVGFKNYPLAWHTDEILILEVSNLEDFYFIDKSCVYIRIFSESITGSSKFFEQKRIASQMFFKDLLKLVKRKHYLMKDQLNIFRTIRGYEEMLGLGYINDLFWKHSILGFFYILSVRLKAILLR